MDSYSVDTNPDFLGTLLLANVGPASGEPTRGQKRKAAPGTNSSPNSSTPAGGSRRKLRKNNREKQRRSELNNRFDMLTALVNLNQKTKVEKTMVLSEAIHLIQGLRAENNELKIEKAEMRNELSKLSNCMQQAFPGQPLPVESRFRFLADGGKPTFDFSSGTNMTSSLGGISTAIPLHDGTYDASIAIASSGGNDNSQQGGNDSQVGHTFAANVSGGKFPFAMSTTAGATSLDEDFDVFC